MSRERVHEVIRDAQAKLIQAIGYLEDARKLASESYDNGDEYPIDREINNLLTVDDRLGDILKGRSK